jgi:hypothetical protein
MALVLLYTKQRQSASAPASGEEWRLNGYLPSASTSTVLNMLRVVLDSNAVDPLIDMPGAVENVQSAIDRGELELLYTHVTMDELAMTPDLDRRQRLILVLAEIGTLVATGAFVLGHSRLDHGRLSADEDAPVFDALRSGNVDHTRDALIASAAQFEGCALVTNEKRLAARAREQGIEVLTSHQLLGLLGFI